MPKCGFCNKPVSIDHFIEGKGEARTLSGKTRHLKNRVVMFTCPHCDTVLGFGIFRTPR